MYESRDRRVSRLGATTTVDTHPFFVDYITSCAAQFCFRGFVAVKLSRGLAWSDAHAGEAFLRRVLSFELGALCEATDI